jgi:hypothetical protein
MRTSLLTVSRAASMQVLKLKKNSPAIFFVAGIVCVTSAAVLASKATLHLDEVLEKAESDLETAKILVSVDSDEYSEMDYRQDQMVIYARTAGQITRLYAPAVVVGAIGIGCLTGQYRILTKRNAALTAAYAALERSYNTYRRRVRDEIGDDRERELHYEVSKQAAKPSKEVVKPRKGSMEPYSVYARFFDETNEHWKTVREYNRFFLHSQQIFANDMLVNKGHVFLNEIYDMLGFERSSAGAVVGWLYVGDGDGYIDFGIFNRDSGTARDFVNLLEDAILLDFNVDGVIYDKI